MLEEITRDTLPLIREPIFRDYARMDLENGENFL